jgi:capsular exopolysaccharide synthesis family protein
MELRQIAATLWKWAWLIILATAVAGVSSWLAVRGQPATYRTSTTLMIGRAIEQVSPDYSEFYTSQQLAQTYSDLIKREPILKAAAAALGFEGQWRSLRGQVSATLVAGTQLMEISVTDADPQRAKLIADEITRQLMLTVEESRPQDTYRQFIEEQMATLPPKIKGAQEDIRQLEVELGQSSSARQMQDLQSRIDALEKQISTWQATFGQYQLLLGDTGVNVLTVIEEAPVPTQPIGQHGLMQVALAAATGMLLAVGATFLMEYLDDTVKNPEDVTRATKLPSLGTVVSFPAAEAAEGPLMAAHPKSAVAEGYRVLRTNLQFGAMHLGKSSGVVLLVTSAQPSEGKTTSVANLGISLAQAGKRVLLVDSDLRRPTLHKQFKMSKESGLTSLLLEPDADLQCLAQETGVEGLRVLPSGPLPANPAEVLGFPEMSALLEQLRSMADYVLLDSPPVLNVADASILAQKVDGVLMVVEAGRTRTDVLQRAVVLLQRVAAQLLGVVLNKVIVQRAGYYDYYYYYSDYDSDEDGPEHKRKRRHGAGNPLRRLGDALAAFAQRRRAPPPADDAKWGEAIPGARVSHAGEH